MSCWRPITRDNLTPAQRVAFGTSGHRGCTLDDAFNGAHIDGFVHRFDIHAPRPAFDSAMVGPAGNGVDVMVDAAKSYGYPGNHARDSELQ
jgi:phosphoglucomutase